MSDEQPPNRVSKAAWLAMLLVFLALAFVALFANWNRSRRDQIETVTVIRFTPTASPRPSATP